MLKDKKLQESLKGIFDGEIGVYDIDKFFNKQGVVVDVHAGRFTGKATLNPKLYGVDISKDEELSNFRKEYIKGEKISFLPASLEKKFISIESATRIKKKELAVGFDGKYMPIEVFKEFNAYVKEQQAKYNETKEEVLAQWDSLRSSFINQLDTVLNKLGAVDKEELKSSVLSKAPSRESFEASCKLEIEVLAFPSSQNIAILDDEISEEVKETLEKKSLETVYDILGTILSDSFDVINNAMKKYDENECFKKSTLDSIDRLRERIAKRNILRHPVVIQLEEMLQLSQYTDEDEIMEALEESSVLIYAFAKSIEVDVYIDMNNSFLDEKIIQDLSLGFKF